jgi:undecaprenyl-diphosphatase
MNAEWQRLMLHPWGEPPPRPAAIPVTDGAPRNVERGGLIAIALCLLALGLLRIPLSHSETVEVYVFHLVNVTMAHLPLIGVQTVVLDQDTPQLLIAAAAAALWFRRPMTGQFRTRILIAFGAFFPTYVVARMLQHLGHRMRPMIDQHLLPLGDPAALRADQADMSHWGSFPSDHSALLAIVTVVAFMVGRRVGLIALVLSCYSCLFRIAYGYHWPSDIAGGALLGTAIILMLLRWRHAFDPLLARVFTFIEDRPGLSAAIATVLLVEFSDGFRYTSLFASLVLHSRLFH